MPKGHSGSAQFLSRVAAFTDSKAARLLVANPSTWVVPSTTTAIPFGFNGLKAAERAEEALRLYLARPVIVALAAAQHGWPFDWTLIEVDGVGHSSTKMFTAAPVTAALRANH